MLCTAIKIFYFTPNHAYTACLTVAVEKYTPVYKTLTEGLFTFHTG